MINAGSIGMPLHFGKVPGFLTERMGNMGDAIVESILTNYGKSELLSRMSDPNWFQALGATHVLLDATFWNGDELSGRDMTEVPHPTVEDTLERVQNGALGGPEIILIHINHTNPLNNPDSPQSLLIEVAGHSIGRRGWRIEL